VTGRIQSLARDAYYRDLSLDKRILYVPTYHLATAWYTAQIFPMPDVCIRQVNSAIALYIWGGDIFRVPLSNIQRRKRQGSWDLLNVEAKCRALFFHRMRIQSNDVGTITSEWLRNGTSQRYIPTPYVHRIPATLEYMRQYPMNTAC
jgi:hypothetical protein